MDIGSTTVEASGPVWAITHRDGGANACCRAGGLGGITAALAAERWGTSAEPTFEVSALTTNARIAEAVDKGETYRVGGLLRERAIVAPILSEPAAVTGPYD